ncbi:MAG: hypothetical protein IPN32_21395 [Deltaproteobacteria bacterium]|nr:hypothetical protein [Deltaproteobacteria bacterium]
MTDGVATGSEEREAVGLGDDRIDAEAREVERREAARVGLGRRVGVARQTRTRRSDGEGAVEEGTIESEERHHPREMPPRRRGSPAP